MREWLYVDDHCDAIWTVLSKGQIGEVYNIGGNNELENIEIVKQILKQLNKPESLINYVKDRLGHDRRYAIDASKIEQELGWKPVCKFADKIAETIQWYLDNSDWVKHVITGEYQKWVETNYGFSK